MAKKQGMSFRGLAGTPHRYQRMARIFAVLASHGFGYVGHYLPFRGIAPRVSRLFKRSAIPAKDLEQITQADRLVMALEALGPTYVKLGQVLSTRPDIIPEEYIEALAHLQDDVPPFDSLLARGIIEDELGQPIESMFDDFSNEPLAAGSIAQVHTARLKNGEDVVIKVKRPKIDNIVRDDLDILEMIAERAERVEELRVYRPMILLSEFRKSLERELDFVTEASYVVKFHTAFCDNPNIHVPEVHWEYTTPAVLTMKRMTGMPVSNMEDLRNSGIDLKKVSDTITNAFMTQYLEMGLFHADPHPGNLLVKEDCSICLLDFGMIGALDDEARSDLSTMVIELYRKDLNTVVDIAIETGTVPDDADISELKSDMVQMLDKYYGIPAKHTNVAHAFSDIMRVSRRHGLILPRDLVMLLKSFVLVNALTIELDPDQNLAEVISPHIRKIQYDKFSFSAIKKGFFSQAWQSSNFIRRLPRDLRRLSKQMVGGKLQIFLKLRGLEEVAEELESATNRIAFSVIVAAVVVGSSIVIHAKMRPFFSDIPQMGTFFDAFLPELSLIGFAGFFLAAFMGMILAIAIWRSGKL